MAAAWVWLRGRGVPSLILGLFASGVTLRKVVVLAARFM
jgi:hypothetical protein